MGAGPFTGDRQPGSSIEEEIDFDDRGPGGDNSGDPTTVGALRRVTNALRFLKSGPKISQLLEAINLPAGFDGFNLTGLVNGFIPVWDAASKTFKTQAQAGGGGGFLQSAVSNESSIGIYVTIGFFLFWGKDNGATPITMDIINFVEDATRPGDYRLIDSTNGDAVVAEVTGLANETPGINSLGTLSNLAAGQAVWEFQVRRGGTGSKFVRWETFLVGFV